MRMEAEFYGIQKIVDHIDFLEAEKKNEDNSQRGEQFWKAVLKSMVMVLYPQQNYLCWETWVVMWTRWTPMHSCLEKMTSWPWWLESRPTLRLWYVRWTRFQFGFSRMNTQTMLEVMTLRSNRSFTITHKSQQSGQEISHMQEVLLCFMNSMSRRESITWTLKGRWERVRREERGREKNCEGGVPVCV